MARTPRDTRLGAASASSVLSTAVISVLSILDTFLWRAALLPIWLLHAL
jgi:hypothetical protein